MTNAKEKLKGMVSVEKVAHFRCVSCNRWWSVADAPLTKKKIWYCAWCGVEQGYIDKTPKELS